MAEKKTGLPVDPTSSIFSQIAAPFIPVEYEEVRPYEVKSSQIDDMGGYTAYREIPGEYKITGFGTPPIVSGGIELFKQFMDDPKETAGGIASAVETELKEYPARQIRTALAGGETFNPETNQVERFDPFAIPATTAVGTGISIARTATKDGGPVLGIMGGRLAKSGPDKYETAVKLYKEGNMDQAIFDANKSYLDVDVLGTNRNYGDAFRFEIPTANSKLNEKEVFDGRMEGFRSVNLNEYGPTSINDAPYGRLDQILDFPELYDQYPEIKDLRVARLDEFGGAFYHDGRGIIGVGDFLNNEQFQSALLHEVQHWVQYKEGFPTGGDPASIAGQLANRMEGADPEMLSGPARDLYQSLYGEAEARAVQRRFSDPEEAKLTPLISRREEAFDSDISIDEADAADRGEEALVEALEYGDISYSELYPGKKITMKAEGGVVTLSDIARNINRGPRGVASLAPIARNMNRPMVS